MLEYSCKKNWGDRGLHIKKITPKQKIAQIELKNTGQTRVNQFMYCFAYKYNGALVTLDEAQKKK